MPRSRFLSDEERARRIKSHLRAIDWSPYRLAKEMKVPQMTVTRILNPRKRDNKYNTPKISTLIKLAKATGTTVGFWIDRKET